MAVKPFQSLNLQCYARAGRECEGFVDGERRSSPLSLSNWVNFDAKTVGSKFEPHSRSEKETINGERWTFSRTLLKFGAVM